MHRRKTRQPKKQNNNQKEKRKKGFNAFIVRWTHRWQWWNFGFLFSSLYFFMIVSSRFGRNKMYSECKWRAAHVFSCVTHLWRKIVREMNIRRVTARVQSRKQVFHINVYIFFSPFKCIRSGVDFMVSARRNLSHELFVAHEHRSPHTWS